MLSWWLSGKESSCQRRVFDPWGSIPGVRSLGREDPLEKEMVTHSSILAWEILWREEPGRIQSMGSRESGTTQRLNNNNKNPWVTHTRSDTLSGSNEGPAGTGPRRQGSSQWELRLLC